MSLEALVGSVQCASLDEGRAGQFTEHTDTVSRAIPAHLSTAPRDPGEKTQAPWAALCPQLLADGSGQHQTSQFQFVTTLSGDSQPKTR